MMLGRKAQGYSTSKDAVDLIVSVALIFIMGFLLKMYFVPTSYQAQTEVDVELQHQIWLERALNNCFVLQDYDIKRTYSGVIDLEKFNESSLNQCFNGTAPFAGIKLVNKSANREEFTLGDISSLSTRTTYALLYKDGAKYPAELMLYVKT